MRIEEWWPKTDPAIRNWLINHNGEVLPPSILEEIKAVAGAPTEGASWLAAEASGLFFLSDEAIDWVEEVANDEISGTDSCSQHRRGRRASAVVKPDKRMAVEVPVAWVQVLRLVGALG